MGQVIFRGYRFHSNAEFALYEKEGKEKGMFEFKQPILKGECEDKSIIPLLEVIAEDQLKGTIIKAYRKNENGDWDYCTERKGKAKGEWGLQESAESKAAHAQKGLQVVGGEEIE